MSGSEVRTGTQRRRSVVVLAAAGSAAALLVAAGVTVVARHSSTPSTQSSTRAGSVPAASTHGTLPAGPVPTVAAVDLTGAVPWIATAPTEAPAVPSATPSPQAARPCTVRDVAVTVAPDVRVTGHRLSSVRFHNVGATACLLSGSPRVVASEPGHPDVVGTPGTFVDSDEAGPMRPGDDTDLVVETTTSCPRRPGGGPPGPGYHHVAVTLSGGGTVTATDRDEALDVTCGLGVGHFFLQQADVPEPPDPLAPLHVTLELPPSVAAGDPLVYVVALTNPTQQPVSLDPCLGYLEAVSDPLPVKEVHALDCAPVRSIAPGATVRFEMRMHIPADMPARIITVAWDLGAADVVASGTVRVIAPRA